MLTPFIIEREKFRNTNMLVCSARDFDVKIAILGEARHTQGLALPQASLTKLLKSFFRHTNKILYDLIQVIAVVAFLI